MGSQGRDSKRFFRIDTRLHLNTFEFTNPLLLSILHSLCHPLTSLLPFSPPLSLKYINSNSFKVTLELVKAYQWKRQSKWSNMSTGIDVETAAADEAIRTLKVK